MTERLSFRTISASALGRTGAHSRPTKPSGGICESRCEVVIST